MRVTKVELNNFASYQTLKFSLNNQGLTLIHGPTGSGKSTLCDAIPWIVFGKTAKDGSVDEVLTWGSNTPTSGTCTFEDGLIVYRSRGKTSKDNDLYYQEPNGKPIRGKDLLDTQKLLNKRLGLDLQLYLSGAYVHEFSATASFFTTTAKARREIAEQVADLSMAKTLQVKLSETKKVTTKDLEQSQAKLNTSKQLLSHYLVEIEEAAQSFHNWSENQGKKIFNLKLLSDKFEADKKAKIEQVMKTASKWEEERSKSIMKKAAEHNFSKCPTCGSSVKSTVEHEAIIKKEIQTIKQQVNPHLAYIEQEKSRINPYPGEIEKVKKESNPHEAQVERLMKSADKEEAKITSLENTTRNQAIKLADIALLLETVSQFRSIVVKKTIEELEKRTNIYLSKYFDSEIALTLDVKEADKLETVITKDSHLCSYTQLSKGQRQLLKLCFSVAVMQLVQNHHRLNFTAIFFDEAFDGLDESFKLKAFHMLETLSTEYPSVFVVEHSEGMKALFANQYKVEMTSEGSTVYEQAG